MTSSLPPPDEYCPFHPDTKMEGQDYWENSMAFVCPHQHYWYERRKDLSPNLAIYQYQDDVFDLTYDQYLGDNTMSIVIFTGGVGYQTITDDKPCHSKEEFIEYCKSGMYKVLALFM